MRIEDERPSHRYCEPPVDGPAEGVDIGAKWDEMLKIYYGLMGWDTETGKPLPETLKSLGIEELIEGLSSALKCEIQPIRQD